MKPNVLIAALVASPVWADPVTLTGAIGPYAIEMELEREVDDISGRYRYTGRDAWLELSGEGFDNDAMRLSEQANGVETGTFFLEFTDDGLAGFWAGGDSDYPVELTVAGDAAELRYFPPERDLNSRLTGQYFVGGHWVNDWFAPNYEIGFNGGTLNVVEVAQGQIYVAFDFVVGPTYHIASFRGLAKQTGEGVFIHNAVLDGGSEPCRLVFTFDVTTLSVTDEDNGFACQFGMRAHANFTLDKVSDLAEFGDNW